MIDQNKKIDFVRIRVSKIERERLEKIMSLTHQKRSEITVQSDIRVHKTPPSRNTIIIPPSRLALIYPPSPCQNKGLKYLRVGF
jgi:chaperone required for assembly of F1-ATPase